MKAWIIIGLLITILIVVSLCYWKISIIYIIFKKILIQKAITYQL
jgi:hypothetical protein